MGLGPDEREDPRELAQGSPITPVRAFGSLVDLSELADAVFRSPTGGHRPAGWFSRKLARECVDPALSMLAWTRDDDRARPTGYCLVGRPASLPGIGRTAGVGIIAPYRGQALGRRLMAAAAEACGTAGLEQLRTVAAPDRVEWYRAQGFVPVERRLTLLAFARGDASTAPSWGRFMEAPPCEDPRTSICEWLSEGWSGTPAQERAIVRIEARSSGTADEALLSREGTAILVHRVFRPAGAQTAEDHRVADALLDQLPASTPVLLHGCPADAATTAVLQEHGWAAVQDSTILTMILN